MLRSVRPSVCPYICLSPSRVPSSATVHEFSGLWLYYRTLIGNFVQEVDPSSSWSALLAERTTKPSAAPFQKHSLGGCTIDIPRLTPSAYSAIFVNRATLCSQCMHSCLSVCLSHTHELWLKTAELVDSCGPKKPCPPADPIQRERIDMPRSLSTIHRISGPSSAC